MMNEKLHPFEIIIRFQPGQATDALTETLKTALNHNRNV